MSDLVGRASDTLIFFVNGEKQEVSNPSPSLFLVDYLRDTLGLKGTKISCGEGACGACTVTLSKIDRSSGQIHHHAINSCLTRVCSLHGTAVTTVEGLGSTKTGLHPVQERIYKAHGSQCGFCTPGMVMSMSSLLREKVDLKIKDVEVAIQGNLCRCTGYRPIVEGFRTLCSDGDQKEKRPRTLDSSQEVDTFDASTFNPYTPRDDPEFPTQLKDKVFDAIDLHFYSPNEPHWYRPTSISEVSFICSKHESVEYFAGGTGKYQTPSKNHSTPDAIIQLESISQLREQKIEKDGVRFGSLTTLTNLQLACQSLVKTQTPESTKMFQAINTALQTLASMQVRNMATLGGHIIWSHPCSDLLPLLMAAKCTMQVFSQKEQRIIDVTLDENFFVAPYMTSHNPRDLILSIKIPFTKQKQAVFFYRRARRKEVDLSIANAAFFATMQGRRIESLRIIGGGMEACFPGAMCSQPQLLASTMALLQGQELGSVSHIDIINQVYRDIHIEERAPGETSNYRRCLAGVFVERFLNDLTAGKQYVPAELTSSFRSHQLFQKVRENQPESDALRRPMCHHSAAEQATGEALYVGDMRKMQGEVSLLLIQSQRANAVIKSVDLTAALEIPGVVGCLTAKDIPKDVQRFGLMVEDEDLLANNEVVQYGQVVAAIACESIEAGQRARDLAKIEYDEYKPPVLSMDSIKDSDEHMFHPILNLERDQNVSTGNSLTKIKGSVGIGGQLHFYLEPSCALAVPTGEKDEMTVYSPTQSPTGTQKDIARLLKVPQHKVIVKTKRVGGGFGGKERAHVAMLAALAAKKFNQPARLILTQKEDSALIGHRHSILVGYEANFDNNTGKLESVVFDTFVNAGCTLDVSIFWALDLFLRSDGGYTINNYKNKAKMLKTNMVTSTAMRGFGSPEGAYIIEVIMDHAAHALNMDRLKVREANLTQEGDKLHYGDTLVKGCTLQACFQECLEQSRYEVMQREVEEFNRTSKVLKRGLAIIPCKFAPTMLMKMLHKAAAIVRIYSDGSVTLSHGGVEIGQGLHVKMIQVASRVLGINSSKIHIHDTSTDQVPNTTNTGGSAGADMNGAAVIDACQQLNNRLKPFVESNPDGKWEQWIAAALADRINLTAVGFYDTDIIDFDVMKLEGIAFDYFTYGTGCIEVEVDCHTGDTTVLSANLVMDVGKSLNPAIDIGQIEGGFLQCLGYTTTEQILVSSETGEILTADARTYKVPTVADIPKEFNVTLLNHEGGHTSAVFSSKAIGEPSCVFAMAVPMAIRQAVASYREDHGDQSWFHFDVPVTADKIRMAATDDYSMKAREMSFAKKDAEKIAIQK